MNIAVRPQWKLGNAVRVPAHTINSIMEIAMGTSKTMVQEAIEEFRSNANGQVVLVLQGGGALGAYQVGVYEALHEAGVEPDWIVGTSIGAINAAIIAGNKPQDRLTKLNEFWRCPRLFQRSVSITNIFGMAASCQTRRPK